jgi:hypothetical protein
VLALLLRVGIVATEAIGVLERLAAPPNPNQAESNAFRKVEGITMAAMGVANTRQDANCLVSPAVSPGRQVAAHAPRRPGDTGRFAVREPPGTR